MAAVKEIEMGSSGQPQFQTFGKQHVRLRFLKILLVPENSVPLQASRLVLTNGKVTSRHTRIGILDYYF